MPMGVVYWAGCWCGGQGVSWKVGGAGGGCFWRHRRTGLRGIETEWWSAGAEG